MKVDISKLSDSIQRTIETWLFQAEHDAELQELARATGGYVSWNLRLLQGERQFSSRVDALAWLAKQYGRPELTEKYAYVAPDGTPKVKYTLRKVGSIKDVEYELHASYTVEGLPGPNCRVVENHYYTVVCDTKI